MVTDAQDSTRPRAAAAARRSTAGRDRRRALAAARPGTPWLIAPPTSSAAGSSTSSRSVRTLITARGPITAVAVAVILSVSLTACGEPTRTATQPVSDAPLGRPIGGPPPTTDDGGPDARRAARAFLTSYLQISYGQAQPSQLRAASRALRKRLRTQNARVPPGVRKRRPRVVALRLTSTGDGGVRAIATVGDGDLAPYPLFATLQRASTGHWVAISVGG
jgi:hypothetical protein